MRFKMSGIEFGKTKEGNTVTKYLLKNKNGMEAVSYTHLDVYKRQVQWQSSSVKNVRQKSQESV